MKNKPCKKPGKQFAKKVLSIAVAVALSQFAIAQVDEAEDAPAGVEEVVVSGFRTSLISAIDAKRNADSIVESISASDIGGLPDVSIADALARVPGLTTNRSGGQAGDIQIRGLSDEFVFSTLGGREQVSPNLRRTIEFNQYPSELISQVTVFKSPKASLIEGGVAGTVDLDVANPLEMNEKRKLSVNGRYSFNDRASDIEDADANGYRISISYQEKFLDDTLGVSLGYAGLNQPSATVQYVGGKPESTSVTINGESQDILMANGFELYQIGGTEQRDGYLAAFQWEPGNQLAVQADFFYSKFKSDSIKRGVSVDNLNNATISGAALSNGVLVGANYSTTVNTVTMIGSATVPNVRVVSADVTDDDDIFSGGINVAWHEDEWSLALDLSHSSANGYNADGFNRAHLYRETSETDVFPSGFERIDTEQINLRTNGLEIPNVRFNSDYTDYDTLRMTEYGRFPRINEDEVSALRLDFEYELEWAFIRGLETGIRASERDYKYRRQVFIYNDGDSPPTDVDLTITPDTGNIYNFEGEYSHFPSYIAFDGEALLQEAVAQGIVLMSGFTDNELDPTQFNIYGEEIPRSTEPRAKWERDWSVRQRGDVTEEVLAYYLQANIDAELGSIPLSGNIGVRVVETDQSSLGLFDVLGDPDLGAVEVCDEVGVCRNDYAFIRRGIKYTNTLPSLNLNFEITGDDYLRFAAARVLSRPPINQLSSDQPVDGDGGNNIDDDDPERPVFNFSNTNSPFLKPFLADQIDFSYEHYFNDGEGLFAVAFYHKEIKSFIQTVTIQNFDFRANGFNLPDTIETTDDGQAVIQAELLDGDYTFSINNKEGGYIQGLEISFTQTMDFLPDPWSGLGVTASAAFVDSEITVDNPFTDDEGDTLPYPGLAERSGNLTIFFEYENFETRLSANYQSDKVGEIGTAFAANTVFAPETVLDFQASYDFGFGLSAVFQAKNLTDEVNASYWGREEITGTIQHFGRQYFLGVNYSF